MPYIPSELFCIVLNIRFSIARGAVAQLQAAFFLVHISPTVTSNYGFTAYLRLINVAKPYRLRLI